MKFSGSFSRSSVGESSGGSRFRLLRNLTLISIATAQTYASNHQGIRCLFSHHCHFFFLNDSLILGEIASQSISLSLAVSVCVCECLRNIFYSVDSPFQVISLDEQIFLTYQILIYRLLLLLLYFLHKSWLPQEQRYSVILIRYNWSLIFIFLLHWYCIWCKTAMIPLHRRGMHVCKSVSGLLWLYFMLYVSTQTSISQWCVFQTYYNNLSHSQFANNTIMFCLKILSTFVTLISWWFLLLALMQIEYFKSISSQIVSM